MSLQSQPVSIASASETLGESTMATVDHSMIANEPSSSLISFEAGSQLPDHSMADYITQVVNSYAETFRSLYAEMLGALFTAFSQHTASFASNGPQVNSKAPTLPVSARVTEADQASLVAEPSASPRAVSTGPATPLEHLQTKQQGEMALTQAPEAAAAPSSPHEVAVPLAPPSTNNATPSTEQAEVLVPEAPDNLMESAVKEPYDGLDNDNAGAKERVEGGKKDSDY